MIIINIAEENRKQNLFQKMKDKEIDKGNKELKKWITKWYGTKCPDFDANCGNCQAWKCYAQLCMQ